MGALASALWRFLPQIRALVAVAAWDAYEALALRDVPVGDDAPRIFESSQPPERATGHAAILERDQDVPWAAVP